MAKTPLPQRLVEIDAIRGLAMIGVVGYHTLFDLNYFTNWEIHLDHPVIATLAALTRITFIMVVGVSLWLHYVKQLSDQSKQFIPKQLTRATVILLWASLISLITWLIEPQTFIRFGILHLIGTSIILALPLIRFPRLNLVMGTIISLTGFCFFPLFNTKIHLLPLGLLTQPIFDLDYFPLIPWFGVVLMGIGIGHYLYGYQLKPLITLTQFSRQTVSSLQFLGQNSLILYLIHQPILLSLILITKYLSQNLFSS